MACSVYREQLGVNLQEGGNRGDTKRWYTLIRDMLTLFKITAYPDRLPREPCVPHSFFNALPNSSSNS